MRVLGLAARSHDSGVALLDDGRIELVYEEERFNREKHTRAYPSMALDQMSGDGIDLSTLDAIAMPWHVNQLRRTVRGHFLRHFPDSLSILAPDNHGPISYWIVAMRLTVWADMRRRLGSLRGPRFVEVPHHDAHAAAYFISPFDEADVLVIDGYGDRASTSLYSGVGGRLSCERQNEQLDSLGVLYSLITRYLGFPSFGDEGKVMGLAAYGDDRFVAAMRDLVILDDDGAYRLNMAYFAFDRFGERAPFTRRFYETFGPPFADCRAPDEVQFAIAFALQKVIEETILHIARAMQKRSGRKYLVFSGGVAMNCVATARVIAETDYARVWVPPCASDAGAPLGAALFHTHQACGLPRIGEVDHAFFGRSFTDKEIEAALAEAGLQAERLHRDALIATTADALADGEIIGWFQGRFETGPRALGNRSILADPRRADMKDRINARIKYREGFRPFAPAVLAEHAAEWFEINQPDPFMTIAPLIRPEVRSKIPAVVHADGTGRIQTVKRAANPRYHDLISAFADRTGVPIVLNTSFNKQEPIVTRPAEAISCFLRTEMDRLVLGDFVVTERPAAAVERARERFAKS
ncbi:MAG: carbamoyltransferase C-terminal domain-containing protein [Pseudomonadota bacterium]